MCRPWYYPNTFPHLPAPSTPDVGIEVDLYKPRLIRARDLGSTLQFSVSIVTSLCQRVCGLSFFRFTHLHRSCSFPRQALHESSFLTRTPNLQSCIDQRYHEQLKTTSQSRYRPAKEAAKNSDLSVKLISASALQLLLLLRRIAGDIWR